VANEDIEAAIGGSLQAATQGDLLSAFLIPSVTVFSEVLGPSSGVSLEQVDPERAALAMPFSAAARATGLDEAMLAAWAARREGAGLFVDLRAARVATRKGGLVQGFLLQAPLDLIRSIIQASSQGLVVDGSQPEDVQLSLPPLLPEGPLMASPEIQAKFMPGLDRELQARVDPPVLNRGVAPVLDLSRYLVPEEVSGRGVQFIDKGIAGVSNTDEIRIPARAGKIIGIYSTFMHVDQGNLTIAREWVMTAGTTGEGLVATAGVWLRQHGQNRQGAQTPTAETPIRNKDVMLGAYFVGGKRDYVVNFIASAAITYNVEVAVQGYYFDEGLWPIGR